jgi:delta-1-pyrroline-5-carboxylate synthetase
MTFKFNYFELNFKVISIKDNDSLAARLAAEVDADLLILMSDVDGIYTCPPSEEGARLINTYCPHNAASIQFGKKSRVGLGGMDSKVCKFAWFYIFMRRILSASFA